MIKGKTSTGFAFEVDPDVIRDYEYLELASKAADNGSIFPKLVEYTLGTQQKDGLIGHLKELKGRALIEDVSKEITEVMDAIRNGDPEAKK